MTLDPVTVPEDTLLVDAHKLVAKLKIKELGAVGQHGKVVGVVQVFDDE